MRHLSRLLRLSPLVIARTLQTSGKRRNIYIYIFIARFSQKNRQFKYLTVGLDYASNVQGRRLGNSENLAATCLHRHSAEVAANFRVRRPDENDGDSPSSMYPAVNVQTLHVGPRIPTRAVCGRVLFVSFFPTLFCISFLFFFAYVYCYLSFHLCY